MSKSGKSKGDGTAGSDIEALITRVGGEIDRRKLSLKEAAKAIGVGVNTLANHLVGEHVRSDSARKYFDWLEGRTGARNVFVLSPRNLEGDIDEEHAGPEPKAPTPEAPRLVVDIFSGCGGLSLGFDLLDDGRQFRTVLALDNQPAPIEVLNANALLLGHKGAPPGRQVDLTEFLNETEFLAFYVDHASEALQDRDLAQELRALSGGAFPEYLERIAGADRNYVIALNAVRSRPEWKAACRQLDRQSLNQTSVVDFHEKLRLPRPSIRPSSLPRVLWGNTGASPASPPRPLLDFVEIAVVEWDAAVAELTAKRDSTGRGQLTASARRVSAFTDFIGTDAFWGVREAWAEWRATRTSLRVELFTDPGFVAGLQSLYNGRCRASVLVGGPPCQGFSRIGRGKIRSLRDARVQVHGSAEAGDARNLLFQQYVVVLGALRPDLFLFENVQHFQSAVKADGVEFEATQVLAEAIENMSHGEARYEVTSRVVDASRHGVPQTRQRYFMAGVLAGAKRDLAADAHSVLALRRTREVPLVSALAGLPHPHSAGGEGGMNATVPVTGPSPEEQPFAAWIRQPCPVSGVAPRLVDGHAARTPRSDDASFFALMGPGKRWMDYRADDSGTVSELQAVLDSLRALPAAALKSLSEALPKTAADVLNRDALTDLRSKLDGSLPLRLLLEQAAHRLGSPHHLLTDSYLAKRDGNHGDWVARLDGSRPSKTMVSHMSKDTYAYVHPAAPRTISVREAARVQTFPDWFTLAGVAVTDGFKMIGNAVPPLLSYSIAAKVALVLHGRETAGSPAVTPKRVRG